MAKNRGVAQDKSDVIRDIPLACADEDAAVAFIENMRWGDDPCCPRCGSVNVYQMKDRKTGERNRRYLWRCRDCNRQYTARTGTVFEDSRIPLKHWCYGFWAACASKKGVSALQIKRMTGLSYKSALFMMHRIRWAMSGTGVGQLGGDGKTVEVDEAYVGGRPKRKGTAYKPGTDRKTAVVALLERGGDVRAFPMKRVTFNNLEDAVLRNVDPATRLVTDQYAPYKKPGKQFASHETVNHSKGEYVRGDVTTNTVEGFFAILKRGIYGTFHHVSKKHLHRYCDEFAFRYNTRKLDDGARMQAAFRKGEGKRLRYRAPVGA